MPSQTEKANRFRALHEAPGHFVIANAWDAGSARILAGLGFAALATSSGAAAGVLGRRDHMVSREEALAHSRAIVEATDLPVSADLEKCFADTPGGAAETIGLAAAAGLVGGSIEDFSADPQQPFYDFGHATERVAAAAAAARRLSFPFTLTARTENFLHGNPDLDDTIRRLQAFESPSDHHPWRTVQILVLAGAGPDPAIPTPCELYCSTGPTRSARGAGPGRFPSRRSDRAPAASLRRNTALQFGGNSQGPSLASDGIPTRPGLCIACKTRRATGQRALIKAMMARIWSSSSRCSNAGMAPGGPEASRPYLAT